MQAPKELAGQRCPPLRIAIPIHSLGPGGVERVALNLATQWDRSGHKVTIVLGRSESAALCSAPPLDFWQVPTRRSTAGWRTAWMVYSLASYLLEHGADVLFCPGNTYAVVGAAMKPLLGTRTPPMVLKVSNALHRPDMAAPLRQGYGAWLRLQGSVFDRIVGLSEPMQREIRALTEASPEQVRVIANPVLNARRLRTLARLERPSRSPWQMNYLAAGRLVAQKNYPLVLAAFAQAARTHDTLTIAGEGPERPRIEHLCAQLGISSQVHFAGHVASIDPLLARADALVLGSQYEGLPGVVVEALAAGVPVLATDSCVSMADLLAHGRTGLLVPVGDVEAFAQGLRALRTFETDAVHARKTAQRFEVEAAAELYIAMMEELAHLSRYAPLTAAIAHDQPCRNLRDRAH